MTSNNTFSPIHSALVTGATGLLGNNLVRLLVSRGVHVKALARSREKAAKHLAGLPIEIVVGEMTNLSRICERVEGRRRDFSYRDVFPGQLQGRQALETTVRH